MVQPQALRFLSKLLPCDKIWLFIVGVFIYSSQFLPTKMFAYGFQLGCSLMFFVSYMFNKNLLGPKFKNLTFMVLKFAKPEQTMAATGAKGAGQCLFMVFIKSVTEKSTSVSGSDRCAQLLSLWSLTIKVWGSLSGLCGVSMLLLTC